MNRNGYFGTSGQKSDPAVRSGDLYFLRDMHFHYRVTFSGWIYSMFLRYYVAWPWTWDLLTLSVSCTECF